MLSQRTTQSHWETILDQLYQHLEEHDRHVALLRSIDQDILKGVRTPMEILSSTVVELVGLTGASAARLYRRHRDHMTLAVSFPADGTPTQGDGSRSFPGPKADLIQDGQSLRREKAEWLFSLSPDDTRLIIPASLILEGELWGILFFEFNRKQRKAPRSRRYILSVAQQLCIAIGSQSNRNQLRQFRKLHSAFFEEALGEEECLRILFENAKIMFGDHPEELLLQVLFRATEVDDGRANADAEFGKHSAPPSERLLIRLSSNSEDIGAFVPRESFCGIAIDSDEDHVLDNPRSNAYKGVYKNFSKFKSQTELAVLIRKDPRSRAIGVLNIESPIPNAFTQEQVQGMIELVRIVSPIIVAIRDRDAMHRQSRTADHYALSSYLFNLSNLYAHKFASRIDAIKFELYNLKNSLTCLDEHAETRLQTITTEFAWVDSSLKELWENLPNIATSGAINVGSLVDEIYKEEKAIAERYLDIQSDLSSMPPVHASRLLKEHLRNIIINAVRSIERKQESAGEEYVPFIEITALRHTISQKASLEASGEDQVAALNQRLRLTIKDNGVGIPKENLERVFIPGFSTTRTSGYGLPAARYFVRQLGGSLEIESEEGENCAVIIDLLVSLNPNQMASTPLREMPLRESGAV